MLELYDRTLSFRRSDTRCAALERNPLSVYYGVELGSGLAVCSQSVVEADP